MKMFSKAASKTRTTGVGDGLSASLAAFCWFAFRASSAVASPTTPYAVMAPIETYLMDRAEEIELARSAAPDSISKEATILVLTRTGYEAAVAGTNGFVCHVGRGFSGPYGWAERLSPKIRAAECQNPQAARSVMPLSLLRTTLFLEGRSISESIRRIEVALATGEIPPLESGAMSYMMSKGSYLTDEGDHNMPHLMFFVAVKDDSDWTANAPDAPVMGSNYWSFTPALEDQVIRLPLLRVFIMGAATWSDGAPAHARAHSE